jgi:phage terminase large subunit
MAAQSSTALRWRLSNRTLETLAEFPAALDFLFDPARYKIPYGGRGSAKSWSVARALLIKGAAETLRIPCCREIQKSIADSVHQLLTDQITALEFTDEYKITDTYIESRTGSVFTFHGLKHNIQNIKSLEGADICWVEEAQAVSKGSWNVLIPTIRKPGSEIWATFNPELESDDTYQRFVVKPPTGAIVRKVSFRDNPWFPAVLKQEMLDLKARDEDAYMHVWEGQCKATLTGAIYANEIRAAMLENRITKVPYDPSHPVHVIFDLGRSDLTAIWFMQIVGYEFRFIDYYEDSGHAFSFYLKYLSEKPYHWGTWWLPHDGDSDTIAAEKNPKQQAQAVHKDVKIVPHLGAKAVFQGIEMARTIFPRCVFDEEKCSDGLHALKHYVYDVDDGTGDRSKAPLHNWASHGADSFRYAAVAVKQPVITKKPKTTQRPAGPGGWMA